MRHLKRCPKPGSAVIRHARHKSLEVGLILLLRGLRLEEQDDLGHEGIESRRRVEAEPVPGERDARIPAIDPLLGTTFEEEELDGVSRYRTRANLVDRERKPLVLRPGFAREAATSRHRFLVMPARKETSEGELIVARHADVDIVMRASRMPDEQIDGPASHHQPSGVELRDDPCCSTDRVKAVSGVVDTIT